MTTPDGRFHIIFNGAIYNYQQLRDELSAHGWRFQTECDTEVLLACFARYGEGCLTRLRGMFAFAVVDTRERTLFLARDPLGIKPLYYTRRLNDVLLFASELNGLLAAGLAEREIDPVSVGEYLAWFAVPAPRTIYRGVANLPPGHSIKIDASGQCRVSRWWRLPETVVADTYRSYEDFVVAVRARLDDTVRAHRLADVPVGAFLSGGLDSSAIVGLMAANGAGRIKTFSVVFNEREYSEQSEARRAAEAFGVEHHEEILSGERVAADLPRILRALDQPTGDGINTYYASLIARAGGVKVALSGLGGDELFGGYSSFRDAPRFARALPVWRSLPSGIRQRVSRNLHRQGARGHKLADILEHARDLHEVCSLRRRILSEPARMSLLNEDGRRLAARQGIHHPLLNDMVDGLVGADPAQVVSAWEMRTYMADVLLRDSDVFSMANSLELRVPFVDRCLIEWWWKQPAGYRFRASTPKSALGDAVADVVPREIRTRKKQGFALPFPVWMLRELRPFLEDTFSTTSLRACPWLDPIAARREWVQFSAGGDRANWIRVWTLGMLIAFANRSRE